jgi:hypothetical protein
MMSAMDTFILRVITGSVYSESAFLMVRHGKQKSLHSLGFCGMIEALQGE